MHSWPGAQRTKPDDYARGIAKEFGIDIVAEPLDKPRYGQGDLYFVRMWTVSIDGTKVGNLYTAEEINIFLDGIIVGLDAASRVTG